MTGFRDNKYKGLASEHRDWPKDYSDKERAQLLAWFRDNDLGHNLSVQSKEFLNRWEAQNGKLHCCNVSDPYQVEPVQRRSYVE